VGSSELFAQAFADDAQVDVYRLGDDGVWVGSACVAEGFGPGP
jgi:hypothetical protein